MNTKTKILSQLLIPTLLISCGPSDDSSSNTEELSFEESFRFTTDWYKYLKEDTSRDMYQFCVSQITNY